jgi:hypothetical protein
VYVTDDTIFPFFTLPTDDGTPLVTVNAAQYKVPL